MSERKRSWDGLDEDLLDTKKGKLDDHPADEDTLLLNDDDDDLLKDSDDDELEKELVGEFQENDKDELNLDDDLDYDEDLSDDDSKRERFKSERKPNEGAPVRTASPKDIPDNLEVSKEVEKKIAESDEKRRNTRQKKVDGRNNGRDRGGSRNSPLPKNAPPVIRYAPPPMHGHAPIPITSMPVQPPPNMNMRKIHVNPRFRQPCVPAPPGSASGPMSVPPRAVFSAPPVFGVAPPLMMGRPPFPPPPNMMNVPPPMMPPRPFK